MAEWDDESFEPRDLTGGGGGGGLSNKWEGEDEDDEVKFMRDLPRESWEDEEEEKKAEQVVEVKPKQKKQDKIAEKERARRDVYEKQPKELEEEISPEEQLRRQKESDLMMALETTFSSEKLGDGSNPNSKEEFQELANTLTKNVQQFSKSDEYPNFAESLVRGICATLSVYDLRKIKTTVDNLVLEKQKLEKGDKPKKAKGKVKAKLKIEGDNQYNEFSAYVGDFEDFGEFI